MASDPFLLADDLGPHKVIHVYEPSVGLKGILVVDNVARGPAIGGLRMAPDVSMEECFRLARAMTLKNAAAGLPHGGGKSVIFADPKMPKADKAGLVRAFADALRDEKSYIFGPDMGTDEEAMAWVRDEIGRSVGLPPEVGGIPLDEIGATGWGLCHSAIVAARHVKLDLKGARVAVQGFGAVGRHAARYLRDQGAILVAANDTQGTIHDPGGLDVEALAALKAQGRSVAEHTAGRKLERDAIVDVDCDIWIPAARPDVIDAANAHRLKARLILQGANIPVTEEAEALLHRRGVLCVPDFIANAGGVICAAMEYRGSNRAAVFASIQEKIAGNTAQVLDAVQRQGSTPRRAALDMATQRVKAAMGYRRWSLFSGAPDCI